MARKIFIFLFLLVFIVVIVFAWARYGWKLWGFSSCAYPNQIYVSDVQINKDNIVLQGQTGSSADSFVGSIYKISDHKLYVGLKYNLMFGFTVRDGSFHIKVPCHSESIKEIYLTDSENKKLIWPEPSDHPEKTDNEQ